MKNIVQIAWIFILPTFAFYFNQLPNSSIISYIVREIMKEKSNVWEMNI